MMEIERQATYEQLAQSTAGVILAVQDTTSFNFAHHPQTTGLGVIEDNHSSGFFAHSTLAVTATGVPIGLLDQQVWSRPLTPKKEHNAHQKLPITEKESMKWLNGLYAIQPSPVDMITVCDREADIYELFQEAERTGQSYIVRAVRNRRLEDRRGLYSTLDQTPIATTYEVRVQRQKEQEARQAQVGLRYTTVTLLPPKNRTRATQVIGLTTLTVQVVEVVELNPPSDVSPIHWILLTNVGVENIDQARQVVRFYTYRWLVERFHYVLKSGCRFEDSQLKSYDALTRFLGLCSHQAWQILTIMYQSRQTPDAACDTILSTPEWQALVAHMTADPIPATTCPTQAQAMRWIAQLGGFIGRSSDGQPGVKVLWRGWQRLQDLAAIWQLFHPQPQDVGNV
jgi:Transposase Tn5 dimerisation domain